MKSLLLTLVLVLTTLAATPSTAQRPAPATAPSTATVAAVPVVQAPATPAQQTTFSMLTDREPVASLVGQWLFQPGDDPHWADPAFDDAHWALVRSDADWSEIGFGHLDGTAWYRFRVILPVGDQPYSLRLPSIRTCYQVFADGQLLVTQGSMPPHGSLYRTLPTVVAMPERQRLQPQTVVIALRIWHNPEWSTYVGGGPHGAATLGRSDLILKQFDDEHQARLWQRSDDLDLGVLELLAAVIAFVLYVARRSEKEFLWFAVMAISQALQHMVETWVSLNASNPYFIDVLNTLLTTALLVGMLLFLRSLFHGKWGNGLIFALSCCGLNALLEPFNVLGAISVAMLTLFSLLFLLPVYGWMILFVRRRARQREIDARILRGPLTFLLLFFIANSLLWVFQTLGFTWLSHLDVHISRPFYFNLGDVTESIFLVAVLTIVLRRFALRSREQDRVESELDAARSVQQVLVPETLPGIPGLAIGTAYHPAQQVGGDFFQILPLPSGETLIVIGDVAGKGVPAALQVSLVVGTLRTLSESTSSPSTILAALNRALQGRGSGFTTCLALRISADCTLLTFANAGHIAPYVNGFELRTEPNLPLGLVPEASFDEIRYELSPGDHLAVLTDGVPEATHQRELFGFERTGQMSRYSATEIAGAARQFGQTDDITVLTVDVLPVMAEPARPLQPTLAPA